MKQTPLIALLALAAMAGPALAAKLDIPVASRVIGFVQPPPSGPIVAAIVFEPGNPASEAEASAIEGAIGSGLQVGHGTVRTHRVPATALAGLAGSRVAFVTTGVREQPQIAAAAARAGTLTITSDLGCVQAGHCMVAVSDAPRVQIIVNRAALQAAGIRFGSAFLMLVKEI